MLLNKKLMSIALLFFTCSLSMGCTGSFSKPEVSENNITEEKDIVELNLWSHYDGMKDIMTSFEKENPNIKVNLKVFPYEGYEQAYKESLMKKEGEADLFIIDSNDYGNFNSIKGLENLLKSDYTTMSYKKDFDKELWELGKSLDKEKLLGIPIASAPIMTYYRKDILEKYGFPGEPEELAEFMKDEENWFEMAEKLKEEGISLFQWYGELVKISSSNMPYFNKDFEYQRNDEDFKNAINRAIRAQKSSLGAHVDIWTDVGLKMIKNDKLVMLHLGSWGAKELSDMVPEQTGKWRVTSLPFGVYGWNNASIISMAENSSNKEVAWKFMEYIVFKHQPVDNIGSVPGYIPFRDDAKTNKTSEFLGGQNEQDLYKSSLEKTKEYPVTPLDKKAFKIWDDQVNFGLEEGLTAEEIMNNIVKEIEKEFGETIDLLKGQKDK
ncbi:MAG: ABC transporter substrate-binding protein [Sarcina sp.]